MAWFLPAPIVAGRKSLPPVEFVGASSVVGSSTTVTKPAGTVEGDFLVALMAVSQASITGISGGATWNLTNAGQIPGGIYEGVQNFYLATKYAGASEPASYAVSFGGTGHTTVLAYRNVRQFSASHVTFYVQPGGGGSLPAQFGAIDPVEQGSYAIISYWANRTGSTNPMNITAPPGWTQRGDISGRIDWRLQTHDGPVPSETSLGNQSAALNSTQASSGSYAIKLLNFPA